MSNRSCYSPLPALAFEDRIHPASLSKCGIHDPALLEFIRTEVSRELICKSTTRVAALTYDGLSSPCLSWQTSCPIRPTRSLTPARSFRSTSEPVNPSHPPRQNPSKPSLQRSVYPHWTTLSRMLSKLPTFKSPLSSPPSPFSSD
jgi:hypothetical protein